MNCKAGDVIAVEGVDSNGLISKLIEKSQLRMGYTPEQARITHIAICINHHGDILEEERIGVRLWNIQRYAEQGIKCHVYRHKTADPEEITRIAMRLSHNEDFSQREYDFTLMLGLWFVSLGMPIGWVDFFNNKKRAICSEYVLEVFVKAGIIKRKEKKLYLPAQWKVWEQEGFFKEIKQGNEKPI